ncbi:MAG: phospholipase D-like domain-containing protein [Polyangiaceae bacterium]
MVRRTSALAPHVIVELGSEAWNARTEPGIFALIATYFASHVLAVLVAVASLVMALRVLDSTRTPQSTLAWLLAIAFLPILAIPLYLLLGRRKFPRLAKRPARDAANAVELPKRDAASTPLARLSQAIGVAPPRPGHAFELLTTGETAYARLMELIGRAARSIDLTMFILGDDETGRAFVDALAKSAARGVVVRLILDAVGSRRSLRRAARLLAASGAEVRSFMPIRHSPIRGRTNLRSHRKLAVFDREHVFAGGMNLADEYMGPTATPMGAPRWRDVAAVVSGPAAADAAAIFESDWQYCGGTKRVADNNRGGASAVADGLDVVQVVASGPDMPTDTIYDFLLTWIFEARARIAIVTPYYVPDDLLQHALVLAARRGVRTEVLVPTRSNHAVADVARRKLLRELRCAGVAVHYYGHGMVHAKAMVVDDSFAYVGSPNFDMRSLFLNYENALCLYSAGAIGKIRAFIDELIAQCEPGGPPDRERWLLEQLARLLAPEL